MRTQIEKHASLHMLDLSLPPCSDFHVNVFLFRTNRSAPPDRAGEGAPALLHPFSAVPRSPPRLPRRQVHPQLGGGDRRRRRQQRQLPGPDQRQGGLQEGHRGEDTHVLLCQRQVRGNNFFPRVL